MADKENINKIPSNEPSKSYVTEGVTLNCTFGDSTVKLQTPGRKSARINGKLQANITDFKPMVNIPSFGKCSCRDNPTVAAATAANHGVLTPMPCVPNTTMPWINGKADVMVDGAPPLLETSKNMCLWGGTISIGDKPKKGPNWGRIGEGTAKIANGGLLCWLGVGALAAAGVALAVLTAPVSVPTLVAAAAIGTVAAGGAGAAICLTTGVSDIAEGNQDVAYGMAGSDQPSRNPLKEAIGSDAYYAAEMLGTGLSLAAMAEVPYLSPFAASAGVAGAGAETAMNRKLASNQKSSPTPPQQKPVKTSALQLEGKVDAVENIKQEINSETVKYYRVQGGSMPRASQKRIIVNENGTIKISNKDADLNISAYDLEHAKYFRDTKRPGGEIIEMEVPKWFDDFLRGNLVPQEGYRSNILNQGGTAPKLVDPTTPGTSFELPTPWVQWLEEYATNAKVIP